MINVHEWQAIVNVVGCKCISNPISEWRNHVRPSTNQFLSFVFSYSYLESYNFDYSTIFLL